MRDPYRVLSVPRDADRSEIHHAFRALARELHPDRGGDPALMQAINEAWAILSRPTHRRAYDEARAAAIERARARKTQKAQRAAGLAQTPPPPTPSAGSGSSTTRAPRVHRADALDYGRYEGWTIRELAQEDPDYLLWLMRTPAGRMYRTRIMEALADRDARMSAVRTTTLSSRTGRR